MSRYEFAHDREIGERPTGATNSAATDKAHKRTARVELAATSANAGGGVTDHSLLTNLAADAHPQYARADGTRGAFAATTHGHTSSQISDFTTAVNALIANVIDGAPGALDTLNELAAALGDDPNYAATIAAQIAGKQPLDTDLTDFAALSPLDDAVLQRKANAWTSRTPAQLKTDLALAKGDVGLGNVDNTSDATKPISAAQQTALDAKANASSLSAHEALTTTAHGGIVASTDPRLNDPRTPTTHAASHATGASDPITGNLDAVSRTNVKKSGTTIGTRRGLNFIEGANVTITVTDDAANEEVDVTIAAATGTGTPADASTTTKGVNKMSVAPAVATDPIAVGTNDPRVASLTTPAAWTAPTLSSGWTNAAGAAGYRITETRIVALRGRLAKTAAAGTTLFTLPAGFRPAQATILLARVAVSGGSETTMRLEVSTTGVVTVPQLADVNAGMVAIDVMFLAG